MDNAMTASAWRRVAYLLAALSILVYAFYLMSFVGQWGYLTQHWGAGDGQNTWLGQIKFGYYVLFAAGLVPLLISVRLLLFGRSPKEWIIGVTLVVLAFPIHYAGTFITANTGMYAAFHVAELAVLATVFLVAKRFSPRRSD